MLFHCHIKRFMRNGDQEEERGGITVESIVLVNHLKIEMKNTLSRFRWSSVQCKDCPESSLLVGQLAEIMASDWSILCPPRSPEDEYVHDLVNRGHFVPFQTISGNVIFQQWDKKWKIVHSCHIQICSWHTQWGIWKGHLVGWHKLGQTQNQVCRQSSYVC